MKINEKEIKKIEATNLRAHGAIHKPKINMWSQSYGVLHIPSGRIGDHGSDIPLHALKEWADYFYRIHEWYSE